MPVYMRRPLPAQSILERKSQSPTAPPLLQKFLRLDQRTFCEMVSTILWVSFGVLMAVFVCFVAWVFSIWISA